MRGRRYHVPGSCERTASVAPYTDVLAASAVELPIDDTGPSMLADTIVRRWQDHQPLYRLEDIPIAASNGARVRVRVGHRSDRGAPPRLSEAELPAVTPLEFVITRGNGRPGLDVREASSSRS